MPQVHVTQDPIAVFAIVGLMAAVAIVGFVVAFRVRVPDVPAPEEASEVRPARTITSAEPVAAAQPSPISPSAAASTVAPAATAPPAVPAAPAAPWSTLPPSPDPDDPPLR
jgi:hypothetical protein